MAASPLTFYLPGAVSPGGQTQYEKISDYTAKTLRNFGKMRRKMV